MANLYTLAPGAHSATVEAGRLTGLRSNPPGSTFGADERLHLDFGSRGEHRATLAISDHEAAQVLAHALRRPACADLIAAADAMNAAKPERPAFRAVAPDAPQAVPAELRQASQAMLEAFGGDVPDWLRPEWERLAVALNALEG